MFAALIEVARDPKHLGADIGLLSALHTWGQNLQHHPHIHCVVPTGGLSLDGDRWVATSSRFLLPIPVLSRVFRGRHLDDRERFGQLLRQLYSKEWSSMPSRLSAALSMCCTTSPATPTASPSPTTGSSGLLPPLG